jgi:hypothetical protein
MSTEDPWRSVRVADIKAKLKEIKLLPESAHGSVHMSGNKSELIASLPKRTVYLVAVRHCSMRKAHNAEDVGRTVRLGEIDKEEAYAKNYDLPKGVTGVPFAIDSHGKWGDKAKAFIERICREATGDDKKAYDFLVTAARSIKFCFSQQDYVLASTRGY